MHIAQANSEPSQTSKTEPFAKMVIFAKILGADYMIENFNACWNFNSLNRDEISSRILSGSSVIIEWLYAKDLSRWTELQFHHGLNKPSWNFHSM